MLEVNKMELYQNYVMQSKDKPLIDFSLYGEKIRLDNGLETIKYSLKINHTFSENKQLMPKSFTFTTLNNVTLKYWIDKRKVPKNRHFVESILNSIADSFNPMKYVDVTYALSVNDDYWIKPKDSKTTWHECNLYDHQFNEKLAMVAFTGYSQKITGIISTPETTANGALKKCWRRKGDSIYLTKGDSFPRDDGRSEVVTEYYATQVAKIMDIDYIPYDLEKFKHRDGKSEIICTCPMFTSADEGYVDAMTYFLCKNIDSVHMNLNDWSNQMQLSNAFEHDKYADMMVFDSLICNQDRHLGNFGYMVDNNTGRFLRPAPIFDNGRSLLYGAASQDLLNLDQYMKESGLYGAMMDFDSAAKLFVEKRHLTGLRKLAAFSFKRHPTCQVISPDTMKILDSFIKSRAQRIISLYHEKEHETNQNLIKKTKRENHSSNNIHIR